MRQGLNKYPHRNGHVIKHKKDDFRVTELRFPNFRIRDFEPQEYSYDKVALNTLLDYYVENDEYMRYNEYEHSYEKEWILWQIIIRNQVAVAQYLVLL